MDLMKAVFCLLVTVGVSLNTIHGSHSTVSRSRSQQNHHARQIVNTIKTRNGDIYDCIDFYEQPAFKHPRLKNHNFYPEMRPNFIPTVTKAREDVETSKASQPFFALENGGCPHGKVPIKRLSKADHARISMFSKTLAYNSTNEQNAPGTHVAIVQTKSSSKPQNYYGVGAYISLWNPQVNGNQYSAARVTIQNGPDSIQAGWMETTYGNWWLLVGQNDVPIGFWPERIFNSLKQFGNYVSCGGETYSPPEQPGGYPPMGSGQYPVLLPEVAAVALQFETADEKLRRIDVQDTEEFRDAEKYDVHDLGIVGAQDGHSLY